jgi:hypothetical protein
METTMKTFNEYITDSTTGYGRVPAKMFKAGFHAIVAQRSKTKSGAYDVVVVPAKARGSSEWVTLQTFKNRRDAEKYRDELRDDPMKIHDIIGEELMDQEREDKPLIKWFDQFEKLLKRAGGDYKDIDPTDMLKLYYKGKNPKAAVKELL